MVEIKRRIYVLEGKPEEDIAMAMAVTSRSPLPFDEILAQTDSEKSGKFLEKFYITYGHGSIADTAFIHIALENISQLAIKAIENTRLAAYQEKSTRYQIMDRHHIVEPKELKNSPHHQLYKETIAMLFDLYEDFVKVLLEKARAKEVRGEKESEGAYENRIRIPVIDRCRLILPASVMGNVGLTMSGRSIEYTIAKLLSSPLSEAREIGKEIKKVAKKSLPILVQFADPIEYLTNLEDDLGKYCSRATKELGAKRQDTKRVRLAKYDKDALDRVVLGVLERFTNRSYRDLQAVVKQMTQAEKEKIFDKAIGKRAMRHDKPLRELELTDYSFDIVCDYGAFRDLQRHRLCTQTLQSLSTDLGYEEPLNLEETGMAKRYHEVMAKVDTAYRKIKKDLPVEAQYVVPMAYKKRTLFHMNLREALYLIELRSRPLGHISYRRVASDMWDEINKVHPYFAKHIKVDKSGL